MLTIKEILKIGPLPEAPVLSGQAGLENLADSLTVMQPADFSNGPYERVKSRVLVLIDAATLQSAPCAGMALIRDLKAHKAAGLGIRMEDAEEIPAEMRRLSDELAFPLIHIPGAWAWTDILEPVLTGIIQAQQQEIDETHGLHNMLMALACRGGGLSRLCQNVSRLINCPVAVLDSQFNILSRTESLHWLPRLENPKPAYLNKIPKSELKSNCDFYHYADRYFREQKQQALMLPIHYESMMLGYILIAVPEGALSFNLFEIRLLELASMAAALGIIHKKDIQNTARRFCNAFLSTLISGRPGNMAEIKSRAQFLGLELEEEYAIVLVNLSSFMHDYETPGHLKGNEMRLNDLSDIFFHSLLDFCKKECTSDMLIFEQGDYWALFIPRCGAFGKNLKARVLEIRNLLMTLPHSGGIRMGVGGWAGIEDIGQSYTQAHSALQMGAGIEKQVVFFDDLNVLKMFIDKNGALDSERMQDFYTQAIGPILHHDAMHKSGFLETLERYIKNNLSVAQTAKALYIHENTLRYRLDKIEGITKCSFKNLDDVVNFSLGLKLYHFHIANS